MALGALPDLVPCLQLYKEFPGAMRDLLDSGLPAPEGGTPSVPSIKSFKVVVECPLIGK